MVKQPSAQSQILNKDNRHYIIRNELMHMIVLSTKANQANITVNKSVQHLYLKL
jgi:hypothetical protein